MSERGDKVVFQLWVPGQLPTLNDYIRAERANRYAAARLKRDGTEMVAWVARISQEGMGLRLRGTYRVVCRWHRPDRKIDLDNLSFGLKMALDGLVGAGVLVSDSLAHIVAIEHHFVRDSQAALELTLIEAE